MLMKITKVCKYLTLEDRAFGCHYMDKAIDDLKERETSNFITGKSKMIASIVPNCPFDALHTSKGDYACYVIEED